MKLQCLLKPLKHGFKIISSPRFQAYLATGIIGVAGLIVAYKDDRGIARFDQFMLSLSSESPPERESLPEKLWVPGLQNLGNNCFLNVVLQALASCSSFLSSLQKIVEEFEVSSEGEETRDMPLAVSLNALLQELSIVRYKGKVLSPRKVMLAMSQYTPNFNLTSQQDAEEALAHMLSSLREECSEYFASYQSSLAVATNLGSRILTLERRVKLNELDRWTQIFLGPFNGIVGSILTCQSCSFQISLEFQFFNCLYLSPPTYDGGSSIIPGCSISDCLKNFFAAERVENYFCTHCWHTTALKYLSMLNKDEKSIEKLQSCSKQDTCDCGNISSLGSLPWSNKYSHTFKQLHIARSPKILCLNLQRASVNMFGELIKLKGHISFPVTLNMSSFKKQGVDIKHSEQKLPINQLVQQNLQPIRYSDLSRLQMNRYPLDHKYKQPLEEVLGDTEIREEHTTYNTAHQDNEVLESWNLTPNEHHTYKLVSVVEHFGNTGSGHYTVYRRVINTELDGTSESSHVNWVGVSDSKVYRVSEEDVLAAKASLLFYERVSERDSTM
uniref:ubiquitin carboxyl-terminal hydrolase 27 n=1 Tax=Erigeron canadensis TaxID=72917 RepID=UPI001CB8CC5D|nr:ubiquitin carboxyl-terminal hydrolase 27 [Erigeron canadensis]